MLIWEKVSISLEKKITLNGALTINKNSFDSSRDSKIKSSGRLLISKISIE